MKQLSEDILPWYAPEWFHPSTLTGFQYEYPEAFYLAAVLPLLWFLRWLFHFKFRQQMDFAFPEKRTGSHPVTWLRLIPSLIFTLFMCLLIIVLARPQRTGEMVEQWTEGIDIMLVLDISGSMLAEDFKPNRLEKTKQVVKKFIDGRKHDRIGIVIFSGEAYSMCPLTNDYKLLLTHAKDISTDLIKKDGTAIGSAIAVGINRMRETDTKSKVMILLSDGVNNAGNLDPVKAAELAAAFGIKMYTIGVGKDGKVIVGYDPYGRPQYMDNTLDETAMREIARIGEGKYFRASQGNALQNIFARIDKMEKAEIKETRFKETNDFYHIYLTWALLMLPLWMFLKSTFLSNALED